MTKNSVVTPEVLALGSVLVAAALLTPGCSKPLQSNRQDSATCLVRYDGAIVVMTNRAFLAMVDDDLAFTLSSQSSGPYEATAILRPEDTEAVLAAAVYQARLLNESPVYVTHVLRHSPGMMRFQDETGGGMPIWWEVRELSGRPLYPIILLQTPASLPWGQNWTRKLRELGAEEIEERIARDTMPATE